jgi:hypothetical protein
MRVGPDVDCRLLARAIGLVNVRVGVLEERVHRVTDGRLEAVHHVVLVGQRASGLWAHRALRLGLAVDGELEETVGDLEHAIARRIDALGKLAVECAVEHQVGLVGKLGGVGGPGLERRCHRRHKRLKVGYHCCSGCSV